MPTTTNYGWTTPADTDLVKDGAAAIRTLGSGVDTTVKNLNPETTLGDISYRSSTANVKTRLALGTAGQVLTVNSGATAPEWATASGGMTLINTGGTTLTGSSTAISSIPSTYINLLVIVKAAYNSVAAEDFKMRLNGDTGSNYRTSRIRNQSGTLSATSSTSTSFTDSLYIDNNSSAMNKTYAIFNIYRYADTDVTYIDYTATNRFDGSNITYNWSGNILYDCSAAINEITFLPGSGTFSGGTVYVYGVK